MHKRLFMEDPSDNPTAAIQSALDRFDSLDGTGFPVDNSLDGINLGGFTIEVPDEKEPETAED